MGVKEIRCAVDGWGVGELWLDGDRLVWHELPQQGGIAGAATAHPLVEGLDRARPRRV